MIFVLSSLNLNYPLHDNNIQGENHSPDKLNKESPKSALNYSDIKDPFTENFDLMEEFFSGYKSDLNFRFRQGNESGNIIDDTIYSLDNLFLYDSLLGERSCWDILYSYAYARDSALYFEKNMTNHKYGFIKSINGTDANGEIIDGNRYLLDNLMPIFLFINNFDDSTIGTEVDGNSALDFLEEAFELLNSTQFWDETNKGFHEYNSSSGNKYAMENLYAVRAMLKLQETSKLSHEIKERAASLANQTISKIMEELWDTENKGFKHFRDESWGDGGADSTDKYLEENALGLITLVEYWKYSNNKTYLQDAVSLYEKIVDELWNETYNAFEYYRENDWDVDTSDIESARKIDLKANALMMRACSELFEVTANDTYHNKSLELYNTFESSFFDTSVNAYNKSLGTVEDGNKNLLYNLELCSAYLDAKSIYNRSSLNAAFNKSTPEFIVNEEDLKVTSNYTLDLFESTQYNITGADITYIFRYPNGTIFNETEEQIKAKSVGSISEKIKITCENDTNGDLNNTYFNLTTPSQKYLVWFNLSESGGSAPEPDSDREPISIDTIDENATKEQVAANLTQILDEYEYENENIFDVERNDENINITNVEPGIVKDTSYGDVTTNFIFTTLQQGENKTITSHELIYPITEDLPLSSSPNLYSITIIANKSFFKFATETLHFGVDSGLEADTMEGMEGTDLYQGQTLNITLPINSDRASNITLNASLESQNMKNQSEEVEVIAGDTTNIEFNLTALYDADSGTQPFTITLRHGGYFYLEVEESVEIISALEYSNLVYQKQAVSGETSKLSFNLKNLLPDNQQKVNLSMEGEFIKKTEKNISLDEEETKYLSYTLELKDNLNESSISVGLEFRKGEKVMISEMLHIEIVRGIEISDTSFPEKCAQGRGIVFTISIKNNLEETQPFKLFINGEETEARITQLTPGSNTLEKEITPTINPYEFGERGYMIEIKDADGNTLYKVYKDLEITLSTVNLVLFYLIPIIAPIGIFLYYKNKDIKTQLLRR
ncbi:MAG: hypothetical protein R6U96_10590 [Promethearchaeia archaeon]